MTPTTITPPHLGSPTRYALERAAEEMFVSRQPRHARLLLDIACGTGEYRHLFPDLKYIGLDIEDREFSHKDQGNVMMTVADAQRLPVENRTVDMLLCMYALDRLPDTDMALSEAARVLKPGALALYAVPTFWVKFFDFPLFALHKLGWFKDKELSGQTNLHYFSLRQFRNLASRHGFEIVESRPLGGPCTSVLKTAWLWWRLARYSVLENIIRFKEKRNGKPFPNSYRKKRGISILPRRPFRFARTYKEFERKREESVITASVLSRGYAALVSFCVAVDQLLFPALGTEHVHVIKKR